ncbi:MAG: hypothetical protein E7L06_04395 [Schaalia turicensis]|nr:hypothetical protein [Schaalia turicensis]
MSGNAWMPREATSAASNATRIDFYATPDDVRFSLVVKGICYPQVFL